MTNVFDDFREKLAEARRIQSAADANVTQMARFIAGRLRASCSDTAALRALKKELKSFDLRSKDWEKPRWKD